ncbi:MAG: ABC transporter permease [Ardenticatenaceae bacterium]|nr:ABC transporter permease [Ardenticatenaceae bacterium]HBY97665.1 peptide ABC transporter permease [Chloroflexota bacterium]
MKYIINRLLWAPVVVWLVATLTFLTLRIVPGDPINLLATQNLTVEQMERVRQQWGLDQPIWDQYVVFMTSMVRGDLGVSITSGVQIERLLFEKMPPTIELAVVALMVSSLVGISAGLISAITPSRFLDYTVRTFSVLGLSMPWFWIAIMLIVLFSVKLRWMPSNGRIDPGMEFKTITNFMLIDTILTGNWPALWSFLRHLALPAIAIGLTSAGFVSRMTRSAMREVLQQDYIRAARARGIGERSIILRHALRNALLPILTIQGLQFGALLGGAVITEIVFSWPGLGRMLTDAILRRDYPVVQSTVIFVAMFYVLANLAVDVVYHIVDPRLRER